MTKKDYVAIAAALANARNTGGDEDTLCRVAEELSTVFQSGNPKFSKSTFLEASGITSHQSQRPVPRLARFAHDSSRGVGQPIAQGL